MAVNLDVLNAVYTGLAGVEEGAAPDFRDLAARAKNWSEVAQVLAQNPRVIWQMSQDMHHPDALTFEDYIACAKWFQPADPTPGFVTDAFGIKTQTRYSWKWRDLDDTVRPFTFAGCFEHDAIEWFSLLDTLDRSLGKPEFTVVELGAGWGPWVTAGAVFARRAGIPQIRTVVVEGDETRFGFIAEHMADNGVADVVHWGYCGVIAPQDGFFLFPILADSTLDMGIAAIFTDDNPNTIDVDYRGARRAHRRHQAFGLRGVLAELDHIDFLHVDIQGAEFEVLASALEEVTEKCGNLYIATHSRRAEWDLAEILMPKGWVLHRERPCQMHMGANWAKGGGTWPLVKKDGAQYWRNPRYGSA